MTYILAVLAFQKSLRPLIARYVVIHRDVVSHAVRLFLQLNQSVQEPNTCIEKLAYILSATGEDGSPVGRLNVSIDQQIKAGAGRYILSILQDGYRIPFKTLPQSVYLKNNKSARENAGFVSTEINRLAEKRCIMRVKERPFVVNPLTVAFNKKGKPMLVLDCRHINDLLCTFKFKYENVSITRQLFEAGNY